MRQIRQPGPINYRNGQKVGNKARLTFRELVNRKEDKLVRVNCNKGVNVEIGKVGKGMFAERGKKAEKKERVMVGGRGRMSLKECVEGFAKGGKEFIFSGIEYTRLHSHRGKSLSIFSHLISETKQKQYISTQRQQPLKERLIPNNREEKQLTSYLSEKKDIKQEQGRPALKIIENINPTQLKMQHKPINNEQKAEKQAYINILVPKKACSNQKQNIDSANNPNPTLDPTPDIIHLKSLQVDPLLNPRFSFGEMMKLGMITPDSLTGGKLSFKLAGEEELEGKRKEGTQMDFQEFSSIISNQQKETRKDLELDSIKNDIDKISSCLDNLHHVPQEKPAPFRFRKKQEVVQHLVTARIVSKQSSSINIP